VVFGAVLGVLVSLCSVGAGALGVAGAARHSNPFSLKDQTAIDEHFSRTPLERDWRRRSFNWKLPWQAGSCFEEGQTARDALQLTQPCSGHV
jgi:hypothetical protein